MDLFGFEDRPKRLYRRDRNGRFASEDQARYEKALKEASYYKAMYLYAQSRMRGIATVLRMKDEIINNLRATPVKKISNKQHRLNREVLKIKQGLSPYCVICGRPAVDAAHLVPKSMYPEHYTNPLNIVGLCRDCHVLYDNNLEFRKNQKRLIDRVMSFDKCAANRYFDL